MRLIRNTTPDGKCKYALVRLDKTRQIDTSGKPPSDAEYQRYSAIKVALDMLENAGVLEYAGKNDPEEAFTIKLKDVNAPAALSAYAYAASRNGDPELAADVEILSERAALMPNRKKPD